MIRFFCLILVTIKLDGLRKKDYIDKIWNHSINLPIYILLNTLWFYGTYPPCSFKNATNIVIKEYFCGVYFYLGSHKLFVHFCITSVKSFWRTN